jgi:DNA-binding response OmpR family regulator
MTRSILIVDDSRLARMAVTKSLTADFPGWTRFEASNAEEALNVLKTEKIDIALLDFNMPGRDGLSLAADLRKLSATMPIAIVSANSQDEILQLTKSYGAVFLQKPLTADVLRHFLNDAERKLGATP